MAGIFISVSGPVSAHHVQPAEGAEIAVSSSTCAGCHEAEYEAWRGSDHGWALREPTTENVLADFADTSFDHQGETTRFLRRDGKYIIETANSDGVLTNFEVKFTVGVEPLQQYLLETEPGRLQAFDLAWDTEQERWFHLYPDQDLKPGDGLHWTGPYKNWNGRCAECHQTDYVKGYDPREDVFDSKWSDLTIGCGACHGPGGEHLNWAQDVAAYEQASPDLALTKGFDITLPFDDTEKNIGICAGCHSRRSPLAANSPHAGADFADSYKLALLRDGLYFVDGQINDEVYVYGSFLQSKMYAKGVGCAKCHDAHSGELAAPGNATCAQCHNPEGNDDFPSLTKAEYDAPSHHKHQPGTDGALCVSCHMPSKNFMQVDPRRDHSFRVPRPDLSASLGTPDACTGCHQDQSPDWAAERLREWFPQGRGGTYHYGKTLALGRGAQDAAANAALIDLALDQSQAAIVRASALDLARGGLTEASFNRALPLLADDSDLLRATALQMLELAPVELRVEHAVKLLNDPALAVRLEVARLLTGQPLDNLAADDRKAYASATADFRASLIGRSDFPETQLQIAGLAMVLRDFDAAKQAFQVAVGMDPQLLQAWITLSRIQQALEQPEAAVKTLLRAATHMPESAIVQGQLGGVYFGLRQNDKAVIALERSITLAPATPETLDLLSNNYYELGDIQKAIANARKLVEQFPGYQPSELSQKLLTLKTLE